MVGVVGMVFVLLTEFVLFCAVQDYGPTFDESDFVLSFFRLRNLLGSFHKFDDLCDSGDDAFKTDPLESRLSTV